MNTRLLIGVGAFGFLAVGCTLIVGNKFSETDDYKQNVDPSSASIDEKCKLPPASSKVDVACGECIAKNCAAEVDYACGKLDKDVKDHFQRAVNCSTGFNRASNYSCTSYEKSTAANIAAPATESEHAQNLDVCVRDSCVKGGGAVPPCRQCIPSISGTGSDTYALGSGECGKCIADACKVELADCCQESDRVDQIAYCAAPQLGSNRSKCLQAFDAPEGGLKPDAGACEGRIINCLTTCRTTCTNGPN